MLHALRIRLHLLQRLRVHPGKHFEDPLEWTHLLNLPHAVEEIVQVHPFLAHLLLETLRLRLIE